MAYVLVGGGSNLQSEVVGESTKVLGSQNCGNGRGSSKVVGVMESGRRGQNSGKG